MLRAMSIMAGTGTATTGTASTSRNAGSQITTLTTVSGVCVRAEGKGGWREGGMRGGREVEGTAAICSADRLILLLSSDQVGEAWHVLHVS
jgi:hypothetical protein